jgi:hypothetical protein
MHQRDASNQQKTLSHPHMRLLVRFMFLTCSLNQSHSILYLLGQQKEFESPQVGQ